MTQGKTFPDEDLPRDYFSGQKHVQATEDDFPDLHEIINAMRKVGAARVGSDTIGNGTSSKAVTFATAFPTGTTVKVVGIVPRADIGATNSLWAASVSETGFTATTTGNVGADIAFDYIAVEA